MHPRWLMLACALGFFCVAAGAFGAHALKARLSEDLMAVFQTGVQYAMFHVVGLACVAVITAKQPNAAANLAGILFCVGVILFSGSLWTMALTGMRWLGAVTPLGGLSLLAGWIALGRAAFTQE